MVWNGKISNKQQFLVLTKTKEVEYRQTVNHIGSSHIGSSNTAVA